MKKALILFLLLSAVTALLVLTRRRAVQPRATPYLVTPWYDFEGRRYLQDTSTWIPATKWKYTTDAQIINPNKSFIVGDSPYLRDNV
jgi:hypothetical protein